MVEHTVDGWKGVPEEAAIIDSSGTVDSGGAVADFGGRGGKAGGAVRDREVVPALKHGIDRISSGGCFSRCKVLALVANLCCQIIQTCV